MSNKRIYFCSILLLLSLIRCGSFSNNSYQSILPQPYKDLYLGMNIEEFKNSYADEDYSLYGKNIIMANTKKSEFYSVIRLSFDKNSNELISISLYLRSDADVNQILTLLSDSNLQPDKRYDNVFNNISEDRFENYSAMVGRDIVTINVKE